MGGRKKEFARNLSVFAKRAPSLSGKVARSGEQKPVFKLGSFSESVFFFWQEFMPQAFGWQLNVDRDPHARQTGRREQITEAFG